MKSESNRRQKAKRTFSLGRAAEKGCKAAPPSLLVLLDHTTVRRLRARKPLSCVSLPATKCNPTDHPFVRYLCAPKMPSVRVLGVAAVALVLVVAAAAPGDARSAVTSTRRSAFVDRVLRGMSKPEAAPYGRRLDGHGGCLNPDACNYDASAATDDGSCVTTDAFCESPRAAMPLR